MGNWSNQHIPWKKCKQRALARHSSLWFLNPYSLTRLLKNTCCNYIQIKQYPCNHAISTGLQSSNLDETLHIVPGTTNLNLNHQKAWFKRLSQCIKFSNKKPTKATLHSCHQKPPRYSSITIILASWKQKPSRQHWYLKAPGSQYGWHIKIQQVYTILKMGRRQGGCYISLFRF